jgi:hypothetical protein
MAQRRVVREARAIDADKRSIGVGVTAGLETGWPIGMSVTAMANGATTIRDPAWRTGVG